MDPKAISEFLAECEAKAKEAAAIAEKSTEGPWIASNQFGRTAIATPRSPYDSRNAIAGHYGITDANAAFIVHARTSNQDLADRVSKLVAMVRERDAMIEEMRDAAVEAAEARDRSID